MIGQGDAEWAAFMHLHRHLHAFLQERRALADEVLLQLKLFEGFGVHEDEHLTLFIEVLKVLLFKAYALHRLG